jgi:hypothetical protein
MYRDISDYLETVRRKLQSQRSEEMHNINISG